MATLDVGDTELAKRLEVSRQTVHNRRKGRQQMTVAQLEATAEALGVDPRLFLGTELDALRWITEHKSHLFVWQAA